MGIPERKQRERDERRRLIFDKTKELILEQGLNGFSMRDVARETELSKGTLYLYFDNKETLLSAILDEAAETFINFVSERISDRMSGIEALRALWTAGIRRPDFGPWMDQRIDPRFLDLGRLVKILF